MRSPLILFFILSSFAFAQDSKKAVAIVNGEEITKEVFDRTFGQNQMYIGETVITKEKVLNDLINRQIGIQKAKKEGLQNNPLVKEKMEDVLYHAYISKELEDELKKIPEIKDSEVRNYYRNHPEYRTAHILFRMRVQPSPEENEAALKTALEVYAELQKTPEKFPELANKYSQTAAAPLGGDIGFQPAFRLAPEYHKAIRGKKTGHITPPVKTTFGYHIIKVLEERPFSQISMDSYKKHLYDQKRDAILATFFKNLRNNAQVKVNNELLK